MRVTIIGSGYVGLVTGACLAETGNTVMCVDKDIDKISLLKAGKIPFHEPGLAPLVEKNLRDRRLIFTTDLPSAVPHAPIIFVAVGPPPPPAGEAGLFGAGGGAAGHGRNMGRPEGSVTATTSPGGARG